MNLLPYPRGLNPHHTREIVLFTLYINPIRPFALPRVSTPHSHPFTSKSFFLHLDWPGGAWFRTSAKILTFVIDRPPYTKRSKLKS